MPGQRRLALGALLGAAALAAAAFPFQATWWGGLLLAVAEAGVVGGLADWFAVTAIFRRPLGLPIPHTGLIPRNWERMAERVGVMVGGRVLTKDYVREEIAGLDLADLVARGAERLSRPAIERATRLVAGWAAEQLTPATAAELLARGRRALVGQPVAPLLAAALGVVRRQGWDQRMIDGALAVLAESMERPEFRAAVSDVVDDLLARYRERLGVYPRLWMGLASLLGVLDRDRLVAALHAGLREVAKDREHPLRRQAVEVLADLERRLTGDATLASRVEAAKAERLDRARQALIEDAELRRELDGWAKARLQDLVERHHARIAGFIENGVRALGPEGAVRMIEEHAGDDLQFIRVNGTVVGGLAGGAIYLVHLLVAALR